MAKAITDSRWISGSAHPDIVTIGDPLLKREASHVRDMDGAMKSAVRMTELLRELGGAGLAAPQVGLDIRVVVVEVRKTDLFPDRPESPLYVMINPQIVELSLETDEIWEGCYSVPGLMGQIHRPRAIRVEYVDANGTHRDERIDGYLGRVIQHEYDHLSGLLFLDRMSSLSSLTTVTNYVRHHHPKSGTS